MATSFAERHLARKNRSCCPRTWTEVRLGTYELGLALESFALQGRCTRTEEGLSESAGGELVSKSVARHGPAELPWLILDVWSHFHGWALSGSALHNLRVGRRSVFKRARTSSTLFGRVASARSTQLRIQQQPAAPWINRRC